MAACMAQAQDVAPEVLADESLKAEVTAVQVCSNFSEIAEDVVTKNEPVTVYKDSEPWVIIAPFNAEEEERYVQEVREAIIEGRRQIENGECVVGAENAIKRIEELRKAHGKSIA